MREPTESVPTSHFAGLLASLAGSPPRRDSASWVDEGLQDDVAVLSYEQALRSQSRRRPEVESEPLSTASPIPAPPAPEAPPASCTDTFAGAAPSSVEPVKGSLYQQSLKTSSVTIRMSAAECSQLHRRAAEAGMTVSAYLRSCAFELESMRRLVKDTMAQLKQANARVRAQAQAPELEAHRMSWWHRLTHWLIPWRADDHQPARA